MPGGQASEAERLLGAAEEAFEAEDYDRAADLARRGAKLARKAKDRELEADLAFVEGTSLSQLGESAAALARLDDVLAIDPESAAARVERGFALYELCRFEEARAAVEDGLRREPEDAWGHHVLGLVLERIGNGRGAEERFARARRLAPEDFPAPVKLSATAFEAAVEHALEAMPEEVRRYLANVPITVEDLPSDDDLRGSDPPLSPTILGIFRGAPYGQKGAGDPWSHFPSSIVLYQRNLERFARDREELVEQIEVTLLHEVGHFLGLDEGELFDRGLD
jgi:predicted Zn-dependent protease with MMP-like domain